MDLMSPMNYVPSFARGQNLLLLHNDESTLKYLTLQLKQFSFNVTRLADASTAAYMIGQYEDMFKIVVAKIGMPGLNAISFMHLLNQKNIQLIFICSEGSIDAATWKSLAEGPCYLLEEPIFEKDLKYLWHNIYQTKTGSVTKTDGNKAHEANGKKNGDASGSFDNNYDIAEEGEARRVDRNGSSKKTHTTVWNPELHQSFEKTVLMLGNEDARPKDVLAYMNVPSIKKDQVKSHLQKYKFQLKLKKDKSSMFKGPSYQGRLAPSHSAPTSSLNMNKEQNQNQMSSADAAQTKQESDTSKRLKIQGNSYKFPLVFNSPNQCNNAQTVRPTGLTNNHSQSLDSTLGNLVPGASTVKNQLKPMFSPTQRYKPMLKLSMARSSYLYSGGSIPYFTTKNKSFMFSGPSYRGIAPSHPAPTSSLNMNLEKNQNQMPSTNAAQTQQEYDTNKQLEIEGNTSDNMSSMIEGSSYQGFAPSHPAPTSLNMNQEDQNQMSSADATQTQQESHTSKQLEIQGNTSDNMSSMIEGSSYQGFAPSHPAPTSLNMNLEENQNQMSSADATQTQQESHTSKQLEIQGNTSDNMSSMIEGSSYQGFAPSHPAPTSLNMNQEENQNQMSSADATQTQQESHTSKQLEIQGNTPIAHEVPTGLTNNESQSLDSILGNLVPEASTVETQPEEDFDSVLQKMREDKFFADEMNMGYDYELNAVLRMFPQSIGQFPGHEL